MDRTALPAETEDSALAPSQCHKQMLKTMFAYVTLETSPVSESALALSI